MLSSFLKVSALFGTVMMMTARCSVGNIFNGGGNNNTSKNNPGEHFVAVSTENKDSANLKVSEKLAGNYDNYVSLSKSDTGPMELYTYENLPDSETMDDEDYLSFSGRTMSQNGLVYDFIKYTFYAKNCGVTTIDYKISFRFTETGSGLIVSDIMRIAIFENDSTVDEHNYNVYAKASADGGEEYISTPESGSTSRFESENTIATHYFYNLKSGDAIRYTFLVWLEGEDPEAVGTPTSSTNISFEIDIAAKEAE